MPSFDYGLWYVNLNYVPAWQHISHFQCFTTTHFLFIYGVDIFDKSLPWPLTHSGRVAHTCVGKLTIIGSDNGLSPGRRQAIIWTNTRIMLSRTLGTNFSEIIREIHTFSFKKMHLKMSSGKWRPYCLGLNVLSSVIYAPYLIMLIDQFQN